MAGTTTITLAGGIKAPHPQFASSGVAGVVSPAYDAFTGLSLALAEAAAAEELRASPAAWDFALTDLDAAAEDALNNAMDAARAAGDAPVVLASDRKLIFTARIIHCTLGIENVPDRDNILRFIDTNRDLWRSEGAGLTARRVEALVDLTVDRLLRLLDLLAQDASRDAFSPD